MNETQRVMDEMQARHTARHEARRCGKPAKFTVVINSLRSPMCWVHAIQFREAPEDNVKPLGFNEPTCCFLRSI